MSGRNPSKVPTRIDPNEIRTRDLLLLRLITGATKAGTHTDKKKARSKKACRGKIQNEES